MEPIGKFTREPLVREKGASHQLGAAVDEIGRQVGFTPKFGRGFYLRLVKAAGWSYGAVMAQLKQLADPRNRVKEPGKLLVWKLKQDATKRPKPAAAIKPVPRRTKAKGDNRAGLPTARTGSLFGEA